MSLAEIVFDQPGGALTPFLTPSKLSVPPTQLRSLLITMFTLSWISQTAETVAECTQLISVSPPTVFQFGAIVSPPGEHHAIPLGENPKATPIRTQCEKSNFKTSFFALLIGVNKYKHKGINDLSGCVDDAEDISKYLTETLGVSSDNIDILRDEQATREGIIKSLRGLASDKRIGCGDPILIFFAGHGTEAKAPAGWATGGQNIQMLVPHDFVPRTSEEEPAQGLLDITFNALLSDIAKEKGDNITVILDSCHAGSSTRDLKVKTSFGLHVRGIELPKDYSILPSIDKGILFAERKQVTAEAYVNSGLSSHVLLAATSSGARAWEANKRGIFTTALLSLLRSTEITGLTYLDVINRLPDLPNKQFPQCEGHHRERFLFDRKAPNRGRLLYRVINLQGRLILDAGKAHGISAGARFDILATTDFNAPRLGSLVAGSPREHRTPFDIDPKVTVKSFAWAVQTHIGEHVGIRVAFPVENAFLCTLIHLVKRTTEQRQGNLRNIQAVDMDEPHELAVSKDAFGMCAFEIGDPACTALGLRRIPYTVALDHEDVCPVLFAAAEFFYNLRRSNDSKSLAKSVRLEAWRLEEERPTGENLNKDGVMEVCVMRDDMRRYGFNIVNDGPTPLYVWVFVFDMADLSVDILYSPSSAKRTNLLVAQEADFSLPGHGSLPLGYGATGVAPREFTPSDGLDVEVMYLKVFLTSQNIDLSRIAQPSPFHNAWRSLTIVRGPDDVWDTQLLTIKQFNH
ncbi:caspase domain-containing protein [Mycena polygramma]|nr:caspase domain-containing protein [Mycena polygramma]